MNEVDLMEQLMNDKQIAKDYPNLKERTAICISEVAKRLNIINAADFCFTFSRKNYRYIHPLTNEVFYFNRKGFHKKDGITLLPDFDDFD